MKNNFEGIKFEEIVAPFEPGLTLAVGEVMTKEKIKKLWESIKVEKAISEAAGYLKGFQEGRSWDEPVEEPKRIEEINVDHVDMSQYSIGLTYVTQAKIKEIIQAVNKLLEK